MQSSSAKTRRLRSTCGAPPEKRRHDLRAMCADPHARHNRKGPQVVHLRHFGVTVGARHGAGCGRVETVSASRSMRRILNMNVALCSRPGTNKPPPRTHLALSRPRVVHSGNGVRPVVTRAAVSKIRGRKKRGVKIRVRHTPIWKKLFVTGSLPLFANLGSRSSSKWLKSPSNKSKP